MSCSKTFWGISAQEIPNLISYNSPIFIRSNFSISFFNNLHILVSTLKVCIAQENSFRLNKEKCKDSHFGSKTTCKAEET